MYPLPALQLCGPLTMTPVGFVMGEAVDSVEFRILGPVEAYERGLALELGGLRERTLLARLLLSANRVVPADRLAEDLWSGRPSGRSMATLRVYISRLRRVLGPGAGILE